MNKPFSFFSLVFILLQSWNVVAQNVVAGRTNEVFKTTDLASNLHNPWEITYGPDEFLWITESRGYRVYRMDPVSGARTEVLNISQGSTFLPTSPVNERAAFNLNFDFSLRGNPQGGLAGLAIHPDFNHPVTPKRYVYISYIRNFVGGSSPNGKFFTNYIVRFTYNTGNGRLGSPVSLCDTLPGSSDHNSQRMIIAPVNGVNYLFYAAGDMGAGQYDNSNRPMRVQDIVRYEGKILRFNLEQDGDAGTLDRWIPNDNPFNTTSPARQSAVWSTGMRNNQGFAYNPATDKLYGSSHGPFSDDELNIIERAKNYGHPLVIGYSGDGNYNGLKAGAASGTCPEIVSEQDNAAAIGASYMDPIYSAYAAPRNRVNQIYTNNGSTSQWPSEAWSGLDVYTQSYIPGWQNSLLSAGLKWGRIIRNKLNETGTAIVSVAGADTVTYLQSKNRYRDLAISPDGKDIFVIMDQSAATSGPTTGSDLVPACAGCVQKYTFLGYNDVGTKSSIHSSIPVAQAATGSCINATTVEINADNNNLWVPITGPDGNILAEINANGNNLGTVTSSFFLNGNAVREDPSKRLYLDRNISISVQNPLTGSATARVRLYITQSELQNLINATTSQGLSSGVSGITDLRIRKNNNNCTATYTSNSDIIITPTFAEAHGSSGYVIQGEIQSFSSFYLTNPTASVLPVQLGSFKTWLYNNNAYLQWVTENEENTSRFIIERSLDGNNFEAIGQVGAVGNSIVTSNYEYIDNQIGLLSSQVVYYRLRIVDIDGQIAYSAVTNIRLIGIAGRVTISPNPVAGIAKLTVNAIAAGNMQWKLFDNTGRLIMQGNGALHKGQNVTDIHLRNIPAGIYYMQVNAADINERIKLQKL